MRLKRLHHVHFAVTNLAKTQQFATEFGLIPVLRTPTQLFMKTSGGDAYCYVAEQAATPAFKSLAFEVESLDDLHEAVARHGASPIAPAHEVGGGVGVTLQAPEGITIELVHGVARSEPLPPPPDLVLNSPGDRARLGAQQNFRPLGIPYLHRFGHILLFVQDFAALSRWFHDVLGFLPSDIVHTGEESHQIGGFFRLDRGGIYTDHHTLALLQSPKTDVHHISFEITDFEAQAMSHRWLKHQGWESIWGVGRHPLGSHVFDLWRDPDGWRFETFSDTDLYTSETPAELHPIQLMTMDVWSSDKEDRYFA